MDFGTNQTEGKADEMSRLSLAIHPLTTFSPRQDLFCYHPDTQEGAR